MSVTKVDPNSKYWGPLYLIFLIFVFWQIVSNCRHCLEPKSKELKCEPE